MSEGRILYVDDERANLVVFRATFVGDLDIVTASSGAEALAILAEHRDIALLLTDQRMPKMSGTELAEIVRRDHPDIIRYLITAYTDLTAAVDAINVGQVHRYLRKPWDPVELRLHLREGLELHSLTRRLHVLERRMREVERVYSLGVVAASVIHELRNPMTVVAGFLDLARLQGERLLAAAGPASAPLGDELDHTLNGAWSGVMRMAEIARAVELSSRPEQVHRVADLGEVVELTMRLIGGDLRQRAITTLEVTPGLVVRVDPTQLGQIALNLLVNALQAIPADRATEAARIAIRVTRDGEVARLTVSDNGLGVPAELRDKIFDPFFTTKPEGGTGLGLAISQQIASRGGGRLRVEDTAGGGATFVLELPIAQA